MILQQNNNLVQEFDSKVKSFFKDLTFDAKEHKYFINNQPAKPSVSKIVSSFEEEKDWNKIATRYGIKHNMTTEQVLAMWANKNKIACDDGHDVHAFAENNSINTSTNHPKKQAIIRFWKNLDIQYPKRFVLLGQEIMMYHKTLHFPGTCDFILYDRLTKMFIIGDYKTNEDLFKNFAGETLTSPFEFLVNSPYNHYQIQLSLYQILFEQIGWKVSERWLIYLKTDGHFKKYDLYDYSQHLNNYLKLAA